MRNETVLQELVETLHTNCGDLYAACREIKVSPAFVKRWQADDPKIDAAIREAAAVGAMLIESELIRRGVHGVDESVWFQGEEVGKQKKYSDSLLTLLAKKRLKETYGDDAHGASISINLSNAINIMPRASTYEEWLGYVKTAETLQLGDNSEEAEYAPILLPPELDPAMKDIL